MRCGFRLELADVSLRRDALSKTNISGFAVVDVAERILGEVAAEDIREYEVGVSEAACFGEGCIPTGVEFAAVAHVLAERLYFLLAYAKDVRQDDNLETVQAFQLLARDHRKGEVRLLQDSANAAERRISIPEFIAYQKQKMVLVVGDYSADGLRRLETISNCLIALGYVPLLVKNMPDYPAQSPDQKVVLLGGLSRFVVVDDSSKSRIDFWILGNDDFSRVQFSRRQATDLEGIDTWVASAEDTILSKLLWYRITPSERQIADARSIADAGKDRLDWEYLTKWAKMLGVEELLVRVREA